MSGMIALYLLVALALLGLNAFFVLAEFAAVKVRRSKVEELAEKGEERAKILQHVQTHLDEYLSVCQLGITFASIGLGFVGEPAFAELIVRVSGLSSPAAHTMAITLGYILVSFLHVVLGELVPKSIAIRKAERAALVTALPLRAFRLFFFVPLKALNGTTLLLLRLFGFPRKVREEQHSEEELRFLLGESGTTGVVSFDRLLLLENVFDLGDLKVRDLMRSPQTAKVLRTEATVEENLAVIRQHRLSRYPLIGPGDGMPLGVVHIKDLFLRGWNAGAALDLKEVVRPYFTTTPDVPVEKLLRDLRHHRGHLVMVRGADGRWAGFLALEDVVEEILGSIEDEFESEPPIYVADALTPGRVVLGLDAPSLDAAVKQVFARVAPSELPVAPDRAVQAILERERAMSTYLGNGVALPHARLENLARPVLLFARSETGIPVRGGEKAQILFILLSPAGAPRIQARLLSHIAGLVQSEYMEDRLKTAATPAAVVEAIRAAEPIAT